MSDDKFKLPQSSYEELTKVIKAYGHFSQEVGLEEVSRLVSLHTTIISRNVGFLLATGILLAGAKKTATSTGRSLARALEHEMPDEIRTSWRTIVQENDFLSKIIAAIRIRSGMDQQTLESHIAYSAGQPKKPQFMTGARTVIEILRAAELIREVDGKYIAENNIGQEAERVAVGSLSQSSTGLLVRGITQPISPAVSHPGFESRTVLNINININCTPNDVDGLAAKLSELIKGLENSTSNKSDS